jgi:hypothetical protein
MRDPDFKPPPQFFMEKHQCSRGDGRRHVFYVDVGKLTAEEAKACVERARLGLFYAVGHDDGSGMYELEHFCRKCGQRVCLELCNEKRDGPMSEYLKKWFRKEDLR